MTGFTPFLEEFTAHYMYPEDAVETFRKVFARLASEKEFGDEARAEDFRGQAGISYMSFVDSIDLSNAQLLPLAETAYFELVPLLKDAGDWASIDDYADAYLSTFPHGKYRTDFTAWKNQAKIELGNK